MPSELAKRPEAASACEAPTAVSPDRKMAKELAKPTTAARNPAETGCSSALPELFSVPGGALDCMCIGSVRPAL